MPLPRTVHPLRVGWYRQLLFKLAEPVLLSAEEYKAYWPYISSAYTLNKRLPTTAARTITEHYWRRLWSPKTRKSKGKGQRGKTIRIGLGCGFNLKDVLDVASGSHMLSRHGACGSYCHTLKFLDSVKKPEALQKMAGAEVAHGYPVAVVAQSLRAPHRPKAERAWQEAGESISPGRMPTMLAPPSRQLILTPVLWEQRLLGRTNERRQRRSCWLPLRGTRCCNEKCRRLLLSTMECGHSYIHCRTGNQAAARPVMLDTSSRALA
jgi:hypothetical protein